MDISTVTSFSLKIQTPNQLINTCMDVFMANLFSIL